MKKLILVLSAISSLSFGGVVAADPANLTLYRAILNGNGIIPPQHFSTTYGGQNDSQVTTEGPLITMWSDPSLAPAGVSLHAVYQCDVESLFTSIHYTALDPNCNGQLSWFGLPSGSLLGYLADQQSSDSSVRLIRCTDGYDHLDTTDVQECLANGYTPERGLGWGQ